MNSTSVTTRTLDSTSLTTRNPISPRHPLARLWLVLIAAAALVAFTGCEDDAEVTEVPELAEVEPEIGEAGVDLEEKIALTPEDIGETIFATGWVTGVPLANGFFLRTEDMRVLFVESDQPVSTGDVVRVTGPLQTAATAVYEEWEFDALENEIETEWDVQTTWYIDATSVDPAPAAPTM